MNEQTGRREQPASENASASDDDWGFRLLKKGLSREAKIGFSAVVIILTGFVFVLTRQLGPFGSKAQSTAGASEEASEPSGQGQAEADTPDPFAASNDGSESSSDQTAAGEKEDRFDFLPTTVISAAKSSPAGTATVSSRSDDLFGQDDATAERASDSDLPVPGQNEPPILDDGFRPPASTGGATAGPIPTAGSSSPAAVAASPPPGRAAPLFPESPPAPADKAAPIVPSGFAKADSQSDSDAFGTAQTGSAGTPPAASAAPAVGSSGSGGPASGPLSPLPLVTPKESGQSEVKAPRPPSTPASERAEHAAAADLFALAAAKPRSEHADDRAGKALPDGDEGETPAVERTAPKKDSGPGKRGANGPAKAPAAKASSDPFGSGGSGEGHDSTPSGLASSSQEIGPKSRGARTDRADQSKDEQLKGFAPIERRQTTSRTLVKRPGAFDAVSEEAPASGSPSREQSTMFSAAQDLAVTDKAGEGTSVPGQSGQHAAVPKGRIAPAEKPDPFAKPRPSPSIGPASGGSRPSSSGAGSASPFAPDDLSRPPVVTVRSGRPAPTGSPFPSDEKLHNSAQGRSPLSPGSKKSLPAPFSSGGRSGTYVVQENDTFWTISKRVYGTARYFQALALYNKHRVPDPQRMRPGTKIETPAPDVLKARFPQLFARVKAAGGDRAPAGGKGKSEAPPGFFLGLSGEPLYRVGKSDTLTQIAQKHLGRSSRWIQIYQLNRDRLKDPNDLKIGRSCACPPTPAGCALSARPARPDERVEGRELSVEGSGAKGEEVRSSGTWTRRRQSEIGNCRLKPENPRLLPRPAPVS
ncbi:MAG: LysM peptidoglycan-binding domain-containing protein [Planctomycetes bacterium]|nr:LysM peptidoglycan-binding domain-containing protein [Planctomycetota bacterium]